MELVDIIIWMIVVMSAIGLIISSVKLNIQLKLKAKEEYMSRFERKISAKNLSRLSTQVRGSVRLFNSIFLTQDDIRKKYKELKDLP